MTRPQLHQLIAARGGATTLAELEPPVRADARNRARRIVEQLLLPRWPSAHAESEIARAIEEAVAAALVAENHAAAEIADQVALSAASSGLSAREACEVMATRFRRRAVDAEAKAVLG